MAPAGGRPPRPRPYGAVTRSCDTYAGARAEASLRRLRGRPRLPLRLHAGVVAALEGAATRKASISSSRPTAGGRSSRPGGAPRRTRPTARASRSPARATSSRGCKGDRYLRRGEDSPEDSRPTGSRARRSGAGSRRAGGGICSSGSSSASGRTRSSSSPCRWRTSAGSRPALRERFGIPVVFYDGDVPMSLPEFGGMDTGFNYYHGADPGEYDLVDLELRGRPRRACSRSARGAPRRSSGRADPEFFAPQAVEKETDVFFYGYSDKFRARVDGRDGRRAVARAARRRLRARRLRLPAATWAARARSATSRSTRSRGRSPRRGSTSASRAARTRASTRRRRAGRSSSPRRERRSSPTRPRGSSAGSSRAASCSSSTTPTRPSPRTASCSTIRAQAEEMGRRARERVLDEHTYRHRARRLLELVGLRGGGACRLRSSPRRVAPDARLAGAAADRDRAGLQRGARTSAACSTSCARSIPDLAIVVVSDGSTDRTAEVAAEHGAHVIRLPFNLGIGGAVQTGFRYAWEEGYELVVRVDGDGQHDPTQLDRVVAPVLAGEADIVVGSRFVGESGYRSSAARRVGIRVLAWVVSAIARQKVTDPTSGLPGAEPPRDPALRRRLPARLPGGRGHRDGDPAPPAPARGAGVDAGARARPLVDRRARVGLLHGEGAARALRRPLPAGRDPDGRRGRRRLGNDAAHGLDRRDDRRRCCCCSSSSS